MSSTAGRWLADLHPWTESVLEEDTILIILGSRVVVSRPLLLTGLEVSACILLVLSLVLVSLEVVRRYSLTVGVLLGPCSSGIEEVVHALESSIALARDFATFQVVLKLNV